jgi:hypothetical protein
MEQLSIFTFNLKKKTFHAMKMGRVYLFYYHAMEMVYI